MVADAALARSATCWLALLRRPAWLAREWHCPSYRWSSLASMSMLPIDDKVITVVEGVACGVGRGCGAAAEWRRRRRTMGQWTNRRQYCIGAYVPQWYKWDILRVPVAGTRFSATICTGEEGNTFEFLHQHPNWDFGERRHVTMAVACALLVTVLLLVIPGLEQYNCTWHEGGCIRRNSYKEPLQSMPKLYQSSDNGTLPVTSEWLHIDVYTHYWSSRTIHTKIQH
eukprot:335266-Rhodomonas_salina.2